ncbi:MAG: hypothetical protein HFH33_04550 [Eubacterium sp.]|nr:hypothetical protein [Eubacterium sp.]
MNCMLLNEILLMRREGEDDWQHLTHSMREEHYKKRCRMLEEKGIEYKVHQQVIPRRPNATYDYPIRYDFYVRKRDYKKACRMFAICKDNPLVGNLRGYIS